MGGSRNQTQEQEPWDAQQPFLRDVFNQAQQTYNASRNNGPWTGSYFAPEDPRTAASRDAWYEFNRQNTDFMNPATSYAQGMFSPEMANANQGYINSAVNNTQNYQNAQAFTQNGMNRNFLNEISPFSNEQMGGPQGSLAQTLNGSFMDPNNPLVQNYLNAATQPVQENLIRNQLPGMDSAAIASGAYGGSANAVQRGQAIGDTNQAIANTRANYLYQNQQAERDRQNNAALSERGLEGQNFQQRQNLLQQDRNMQGQMLLQQFGQNSQNAFNSAGMEAQRNQMLAGLGESGFNRGLQASSMMPGFFQAAQMPYQQMSSLGDAFTQSDQRLLDNARQMWEQPSQFQWGQLGNYGNMVNGNYGFTGQSSGGGGSQMMGGLGGAMLGGMGGSALGSSAFMAPMIAANPWLAPALIGGGALLGGGAGFFGS